MLMSNYFTSTIWTWFVITMWTPMYVRYLWTICELWCNMWLVMLNHVRSWFVCWFVWDPSWFHRTTEFIRAQVWWFDRFGDCYCTCALINWTVLLQLALEQGSTLNLSHGYLKQRFYFIKSCWQLIAKYRCVKNLNFKFRVCQWSYPLCPVKDY